MFYLDLNLLNISDARDLHCEKLGCYIRIRLGRKGCGNCSICKSTFQSISNLDRRIASFFTDQIINDLLRGTPDQLIKLNNRFWKIFFPTYSFPDWYPYFNKKHIHANYNGPHKVQAKEVFEIIKQLEEFLDYDWFNNKKNKHYSAYDLVKGLDRNTCTYCNRSYTSTVIVKNTGEKIIRPTLDHWFPQSQYPLLAVSFQNLIPSCYNCNSSIKGAVDLNLTDHIHPYVDQDQIREFKFGYFYSGKLDEYRISIQDINYKVSRARQTLQSMFLDEVYNSHHSELKDLITLKKSYSKSYIKSIQKIMGNKLPEEEIYRLLFGVYYSEADFHKRPLSKFKYDILKQLDMID